MKKRGLEIIGLCRPQQINYSYGNDNDNDKENISFNIDIINCRDVIQITVVSDVIHILCMLGDYLVIGSLKMSCLRS